MLRARRIHGHPADGIEDACARLIRCVRMTMRAVMTMRSVMSVAVLRLAVAVTAGTLIAMSAATTGLAAFLMIR